VVVGWEYLREKPPQGINVQIQKLLGVEMRQTLRGTGPGGDVTGSVVGGVRRARVRESVYVVPPCSTGT